LRRLITFQTINQAARYRNSPIAIPSLPEGVWLLLGIHLHRPILELAAHAQKATRHETDDVAVALGLPDVAARGRGFHMSRQCAGCFEVAGTAGAAVLDPRVGLDVDDERILEEITLPATVVSEIGAEEVGGPTHSHLGKGQWKILSRPSGWRRRPEGTLLIPDSLGAWESRLAAVYLAEGAVVSAGIGLFKAWGKGSFDQGAVD